MTVRFNPPVTLRLIEGEVLAWHQGAARVRVMAGRVWITRQGDLADHFLGLGQSFELRREHGTVIGIEQEAWLRFDVDPSRLTRLTAVGRRVLRRLTALPFAQRAPG